MFAPLAALLHLGQKFTRISVRNSPVLSLARNLISPPSRDQTVQGSLRWRGKIKTKSSKQTQGCDCDRGRDQKR
jgi:hypothetical protein